MKSIPLADRVVIKSVEVEETSKGGLILTGSAKEKPQVAQVIAVGPGGVVDGKEVKMTVKVGDKVLTSKYSGTEVKVDGEECTIVRQSDILSVVEDYYRIFPFQLSLYYKGAMYYGKADQAGRGRSQGTVCRY